MFWTQNFIKLKRSPRRFKRLMYLRDASSDSDSERQPVTTNFPEEKASAVERLVFDLMRMAQAANRLGWNSKEYDCAKCSKFNGLPQVNVATTLLMQGTGTGCSVGSVASVPAAEFIALINCVQGTLYVGEFSNRLVNLNQKMNIV